MPTPPPRFARLYTCPACQYVMSLEYRPSRDRQPVPTSFDCPGCGESCMADLPGELRQIGKG